MSDSVFIRHGPCPHCGSTDANAEFSDGHHFCYSCKTRTNGDSMTTTAAPTRGGKSRPLIEGVEPIALTARALSLETTTKFGYGVAKYNGETVQVAPYRDKDGKLVGQKVRTADKRFSWAGTAGPELLFGRHLWRGEGKMLVITEGEIDAMSVSQAQGNKWPVVSVPNGAQSAHKAIAANLEWLEQFEKVVFMFDMDSAGQEAALKCASVLTPGKAYIASLPLKDANEMLKAGRGSEIIDSIWGARPFRPDGIVCGSELWDRVRDTKDFESLPYPWEGLNALTRGLRDGEVVVFTAGTGVGKSEVVRSVVANLHDNYNEKVGYIALEESVERTARGLMGLYLGKRIHLGYDNIPESDLKRAFDATVGSGRYFLYDHWGSLDRENLRLRIRYLAKACGCKTVVLDHISIAISGLDIADERKALDVLMSDLKSIAMETRIKLIVICHLRRDGDTSHEEGGRVELRHLRGSQAIAQLGNIVVALERDLQATGPKKAYTTVRVLKNRHTGDTGEACVLKYDSETGRLEQSVMPADLDETGFKDETDENEEF